MMAFSFLKKTISIAASGLVVLSLAACHGILSATGTKCWLTINYKYPY